MSRHYEEGRIFYRVARGPIPVGTYLVEASSGKLIPFSLENTPPCVEPYDPRVRDKVIRVIYRGMDFRGHGFQALEEILSLEDEWKLKCPFYKNALLQGLIFKSLSHPKTSDLTFVL